MNTIVKYAAAATLTGALALASAMPSQARNGRNAAAAIGFGAGALVGAAAAGAAYNNGYYYGDAYAYEPGYVYAPGPTYDRSGRFLCLWAGAQLPVLLSEPLAGRAQHQ